MHHVRFRFLTKITSFSALGKILKVQDLKIFTREFILILDSDDLKIHVFKIEYENPYDKTFSSNFKALKH